MWEFDYKELIYKILNKGELRDTRAGKVKSIFGEKLVINTSNKFPLLTGRKMFYKPVLGELAAMLKKPKNVQDFKNFGCNYWDSWADKEGNLNVDYGNAWLDFNGVNQLEKLVHTLKTNPTDRRMIISGWRPDKLEELSLPCCHMLYQWYVRDNRYLDMIWYQRSVDTMIGLPSDIIVATAWNMLLANECGFRPGNIVMMLADTHIYMDHLQGAEEYLETNITNINYAKPHSNIAAAASVFNFHPDMIELIGYKSAKPIKFKLNI